MSPDLNLIISSYCVVLQLKLCYALGQVFLAEPVLLIYIFFFFGSLSFPQHMEVPRLGVKLELQLPAYATAIATPDLSGICHLHHSSQ